MSAKKSYMSSNNILSEGFLDKLFKKIMPNAHKKTEEMYLKRKLEKHESELQKAINKSNMATRKFEKAFEKETGRKINLDDISLEDVLKRYR